MLIGLSVPCLTFTKELRHQLDNHSAYQCHLQEVLTCPTKHPRLEVSQGLILSKGRIWLPRGLPIAYTLLTKYHTTPTVGHTGVTKTLARIMENFIWLGLREDVAQFMANCVKCQVTKYEAKKMAGLLCPLPVPHRPWEDLSLDFIVGLPSYQGNTMLLVGFDRFSKGIHLGMLPSNHSAIIITHF